MLEVVVTNGAIRRGKLQSKCHHRQTNTQFLRPGALPVAQPTVAEHWKEEAAATAAINNHLSLPFNRLCWVPWMKFGDCWWDTFTGWKPLRTPTNSVKALTAKMKKTMHLDSNLSLAFVLDNIRSRSLVHHAEWSLADWTTDLDFLTWDFPFVSNVHYGQTQHSV